MPTTRDSEELRTRFTTWLQHTLPAGADPQVGPITSPEATGMSSETLFFEAQWREDNQPRTEQLVARLAPEDDAFPVFPQYDLELQYNCLKLMQEHTEVPVPPVFWYEPDADHVGSAFFVTRQVAGQVPPDMMPYTMQGWVLELTDDQRATLLRNALTTLAQIHRLTTPNPALDFLDRPQFGAGPIEQHLTYQQFYYDWARGSDRYDVIEEAFAWLAANRPPEPPTSTVNWGDSRIGNMIFQNLRPAAVLDWEMAALGPPEVDLAWFFQMHVFFQSMAERYGMPGVPDFFKRQEVMRLYEEAAGSQLQQFEFWEVFAQLRYAVVSIRTSERAIQTGQMDDPGSLEERIMNAELLRANLDGSFLDSPLAQ